MTSGWENSGIPGRCLCITVNYVVFVWFYPMVSRQVPVYYCELRRDRILPHLKCNSNQAVHSHGVKNQEIS